MLSDDYLNGIKGPRLDQRKEMKVQLPLRHLVAISELRIVRNMTASDVVEEALAHFFSRNRQPGQN